MRDDEIVATAQGFVDVLAGLARMGEAILAKLDHVERKLNDLTEEVKKLNEQDQALTDAVTKLSADFTAYQTAIDAEVASLQGSPAATDPAVATAITNLTALSASIEASTAAIAAIAPAAPAQTGSTAS